MKAVISLFVLLSVCVVLGGAQQPTRPNGEEGRIIALESAWDQAEQNKDASALANLLADNIVYVDYDGSISTKQQLLAEVKSADVILAARALYQRLAEPERQMGMHRKPVDINCALRDGLGGRTAA